VAAFQDACCEKGDAMA